MRETGNSSAIPDEATTDHAKPAWRLWLTQLYTRQALARFRELAENRRQLRGQRGNGWRRKGLRRRLANAASCFVLALGLLRGVMPSGGPIHAATIPFTGSTIDGAFDGAVSLTHADLDGDGDLDVLGAALIADTITWWESDGTPADGGWTTHTVDGAFDGANSVAAADLDGDGDLDVLGVAEVADDITWWENDGTPADGGWTTHTIDGTVDRARSVVAADLDGDGDLDVLGAASLSNDITWWENDGTPADGGWTTHTIFTNFAVATSVAAADLDGDGDLDVLGAAEYADDITWWESDGTPADGGWITHTIDGNFDGARSAAAADLDGDGDLDVLGAAHDVDDITWWENRTIHRNALFGGGIPFTHTIDGAFDGPFSVTYADLLYRVRLSDGRPAFVYALAEHKSRPSRLVALQLLGYMVAIWQQHQRREPGAPLPPIIPIVVYHGRAAWTVAPGFGGLFEGPEALRPYWPDFRYELADLSLRGADEVPGEAALRLVTLVLRHVFDARLAERLPGILTLVLRLPDSETAVEFLNAITRYLSQAGSEMTEEAVDAAARLAFAEPGDVAMTTVLETWLQERWQQGVRQGLEEGARQGLEEGVRQGMEVGVRQGERAGLVAGIELALELKFGVEGLVLMPDIRAIDDLTTLHAVHAAIRTARTPAEVRAAYSSPTEPDPVS